MVRAKLGKSRFPLDNPLLVNKDHPSFAFHNSLITWIAEKTNILTTMPPEVQDLLPAPIPTSPGEEYVSNSPPITLTRSPANMASSNLDDDDSQTAASGFLHIFKKQQKPQQEDDPSTKDEFHPYVQTLSIADLESCIALENAAFPEDERCSREKVSGIWRPIHVLPAHKETCAEGRGFFLSFAHIFVFGLSAHKNGLV